MSELHYPFPPGVARLFDRTMVNAPSAWGILEGILPGVIAVDNVEHPTWAVGRMYWDTGVAAGRVDCDAAAEATQKLARWGSFKLFRDQADPDVPGASGAATERLEFSGVRSAVPEPVIPTGCEIALMTLDLLKRSRWGEGTATIWGGAERFVERGIGVCLLRDGEIVCETPAFAVGAGRAEIAVVTHPDHQGRGYAKLTCFHMAKACEARGLMPTYSCDRSNVASAAVARSLGFSIERACRSVPYGKDE